MQSFKRIVNLAITVVIFTIVLFVLVASNSEKLRELEEEPVAFYCGTSAMENKALTDPVSLSGQALFNANCKTCHRLDQKLIGPPLRNVWSSRDSVWLRKMIIDGNALVRAKDERALALYFEYARFEHVAFTGLKKEQVDDLMKYLRAADQMTH